MAQVPPATTRVQQSWASSYVVHAGSPTAEAATGEDYQTVLVPLTASGVVYEVVSSWSDNASGVVWAVAAFAITVLVMRDNRLNRYLRRFARFLQRPS
jgi:type IV secretory pathway TrbD component